MHTVTLEKTSAGLGFSLEGGKGSLLGDKPLTVNRIFKGELCVCLSGVPSGCEWRARPPKASEHLLGHGCFQVHAL